MFYIMLLIYALHLLEFLITYYAYFNFVNNKPNTNNFLLILYSMHSSNNCACTYAVQRTWGCWTLPLPMVGSSSSSPGSTPPWQVFALYDYYYETMLYFDTYKLKKLK